MKNKIKDCSTDTVHRVMGTHDVSIHDIMMDPIMTTNNNDDKRMRQGWNLHNIKGDVHV